MKRIIMVHDYPPITGGGLETNTYALSKELVRRGYSVTIATTRFESAAYCSTEVGYQDDVKIKKIVADASLANLISDYDIVYVHLTFSIRPGAILAGEMAIQQGKKIVATIHTAPEHIPFSSLSEMNEVEREHQVSRLLAFLNNPQVKIVVATRALKSQLHSFGVQNVVEVIHFGVDFVEYSDSKKPFDVVYVGRVSYLKGISYLLDALRFLKQGGLAVQCGIIGDGAELPLFKSLSAALELEELVDFVGFVENREDIYGYIKNAKLLVLPSLTEVFPQVMIESQMVGTPVVASNLAGITEHFAQSGGGICFEVGNAKDLAQKMQLLLENPALRVTLGLQGQQYCMKHATTIEQANQLEKVLIN